MVLRVGSLDSRASTSLPGSGWPAARIRSLRIYQASLPIYTANSGAMRSGIATGPLWSSPENSVFRVHLIFLSHRFSEP